MEKFGQRLKTDKMFRTKLITYITMIYNFVWSIVKILVGVLRWSWVYLVNGVYNIFIGGTKNIFLLNHGKDTRKDKPVNKEKNSKFMGMLLLISGFTFTIYMGSLFIYHSERTMSLPWSIFMATCSFVEFGIAIYNLVKVRKKDDILLFSLRCTNLVSAIYAIVLTQVALLSTKSTVTYAYVYNAITGIIAGLLAIAIGTVLMLRADKLLKEKQQASVKEDPAVDNESPMH